jgi:hypothetical protein
MDCLGTSKSGVMVGQYSIRALDVMVVVGPEYRHGLGLGPQNLETRMVNWYSKGALDVTVLIGPESRSTNQWIRTWICAVRVCVLGPQNLETWFGQ